MTQTISIHEQEFLLHPSGAIYWISQSMLLIADVHLGKVAHFRKHGAAIPAEVGYQNLEKLTEVVNELEPKTVCFLGDLFHSKRNASWEDFESWVSYTKAKVILIHGNHDIIPKYLFEYLGVITLDEMVIQSFLLTHHPTERANLFNFHGHIHPGVRMRGPGRQTLKLPCFYKSETHLILPAFGTFTGKYILQPTEKEEVYVIVEGEVVPVS